jgi:hypothetical protein
MKLSTGAIKAMTRNGALATIAKYKKKNAEAGK